MRWLAVAALLAACGGEERTGAVLEAPPTPEGDDNVMPLGNVGIEDGGLYNDLAISGRYIYGCTAAEGLKVAYLESWTDVAPVANVAFEDGDGCRSVATAPDGMAFAGGLTAEGDSWIAAVSDGAGPEVTSTVALDGVLLESVEATDSHVFAALGKDGIAIFGRNDGALSEVGRLDSGFDQALGLTLWGSDRLVVANSLSGIVIVDISDPAAPAVESSFDTPGTARRVVIENDIAYVAAVASGVTVHDLNATSPATPLSRWITHGQSVDLAMAEGSMLLVANLEDLSIVDATDPADIKLAGTEQAETPTGGVPRVVAVEGTAGVAYSAEWSAIWTHAFTVGAEVPDIQLAKLAVDFGIVSGTKGKGILIQNLGAATLEVGDIVASHPAFSAEVDPPSVKPGTKALLELKFTPEDSEPIEGTVTLATNDPDETAVTIRLQANSNDRLVVGKSFDPDGQLTFQDHATGGQVTVKGEHAGKVVILAFFGSS